MLKTLVLVVITGCMLLQATASIADETNWFVSIKASDLADMHSAGNSYVGCIDGFTDGIDNTKGEPTIPPYPGPGQTLAAAVAVLPDGAASMRDFRAPLNQTYPPVPKTWSLKLCTITNGGSPLNGFKLTVTPDSSTFAPAYTFTGYVYRFRAPFIPGGAATFAANYPMPQSFSFVVTDQPVISLEEYMTFEFIPVPEPSSLLALFCGISGIVGAIWRQKPSN